MAAEAADAGGTCAAASAGADAASERLAGAVSAAAQALPASAVCRAALLTKLAGHCRRATSTERAFLRNSDGAARARSRTTAGIRARLTAAFPADCAGDVTADETADTLFRLAGIAIGDATTRGLRVLGQDAGILIGAAVESHEVANDPNYPPVLADEVASLTAENAMKWGPLNPQAGTYNFTDADAVVAFAEAGAQRLRGHTLVWGAMQLPSYVQNAASANELRGYITDHVTTAMGRWAGRIAQWDVVNEPLPSIVDPPTPDGLDDNVFRRLLGPGYVAEALQLARAADPTAKLYVNENGIEVPGPRQDRFFTLVQELLAAGAPLDGVGFQAHLGLIPITQYPDAATIEASLRRFADLGLEVELTELDVTLIFRAGDLPTRLAFQGDYYRDVVEACTRIPACTGITLWGLADRYSWLRTFFGFTDWPLPFDDDWRRKPAYFGMRAALAAAALRNG
jgi:endo-1,4-beta-xylanase